MVESFNVRVVTSISVTDTGDVIDRFITLEKRHHNEKSRQHTLTLSSTTYSGHQNNDITNIDYFSQLRSVSMLSINQLKSREKDALFLLNMTDTSKFH